MWIRIKTDEGRRINIPVPLGFVGSPFVLKAAARCGGPEAAKYAPVAKDLCRELKRYVRTNGHFTLVDVESSDGTLVRITV